jgi:NitT/TauT family transport system substrate-binding protein
MRLWSRLLPLCLAVAGLCVLAARGGQGAAPVRLAYLQNDLHHLALWVALDKGFFRDEGVDVTVAGVFRAGSEVAGALGAGQLDMAYLGEAPATIASARGAAHIRVVAQVNTEGSGLVARPGAGVAGIEDLRGKTVAVPGLSSVQDILLRKALAARGIPESALSVVVLDAPEMIPALRAGQIDAFLAWEPYPSRAELSGAGRIVSDSAAIWPRHPCCVLVADKAFLAAHPAEAAAVVRAHARATAFIREHPEDAAAVAAKYTGASRAEAAEAMRRVRYDTRINVEGEREYLGLLTRLGFIAIKDPDRFLEDFLGATATAPDTR